MSLRIKDLVNLPDAVIDEFERRSTMRADALAHKLVNKITGSNMQANPNVYNPYLENNSENINVQGDASSKVWDKNSKNKW